MLDEKIETLIALSDNLNYSKTAELLGLTQPAVSQHIKRLENELQIKIFNRVNGNLKVTTEGEIAIIYAKRIKSLYERLQNKIADSKKSMKRLIIGITHTQESNKMVEVLSKFSLSNDNVSITIITDTIKNLYNKLENFEIDFAIIEGKPSIGNLNYIMLDTDYLVCIVPPTHRLAKESMISLADLKKENLILRLPSSDTRILFESALKGINQSIDDFDVSIQVDNVATIKNLVRNNIGVSILARSTCQSEIKKEKLIALPIENLNMIRETNIVYHKSYNHTETINSIFKFYNELVKTH